MAAFTEHLTNYHLSDMLRWACPGCFFWKDSEPEPTLIAESEMNCDAPPVEDDPDYKWAKEQTDRLVRNWELRRKQAQLEAIEKELPVQPPTSKPKKS